MRVLAFPLVLLVVVIAVAVLVTAFRPARDGRARWEATTELHDDVTVVLIRHLAGGREQGRQVVAELPAGLPDWDTRYHEAMAEARSRAAALHSESD